MGQDLRRHPHQVLAPVRVVRQPGQAGLSRASTLFGLVFQAQGRVRAHAEGVRGLPPRLPQAWNADLQRLAGVLQQPGRCPLPGGAPEDEGVLHRPWGGHLQGRGLPPGCIPAVHLAEDAATPPGGYKPPELYAPNAEAYAMLKAAVVGGPSLVFTRKHVAGETRIRSHQYEDARVCRRILGYDANSLYPSTMIKEMPCGPWFVQTCNNPEACALVLPQLLRTKQWFRFAEVDIEVPRELWPKFEEFPPLFVNRGIPDNLVPQHMHDYLRQSGHKRFPEQQSFWVLCRRRRSFCTPPSWSGTSPTG